MHGQIRTKNEVGSYFQTNLGLLVNPWWSRQKSYTSKRWETLFVICRWNGTPTHYWICLRKICEFSNGNLSAILVDLTNKKVNILFLYTLYRYAMLFFLTLCIINSKNPKYCYSITSTVQCWEMNYNLDEILNIIVSVGHNSYYWHKRWFISLPSFICAIYRNNNNEMLRWWTTPYVYRSNNSLHRWKLEMFSRWIWLAR